MALRHLVSWETDRILWIDAVCIDQDDHKERGHQVEQMGKIYRQAEKVIVWLGHSTARTDSAMAFMEDSRSQDGQARPDTRITKLDPEHPVVKGFDQILGRPWFRRIWILQEVANARYATIACGKKSVPARTFVMAAQTLEITIPPHAQVVLDLMPGPSRKKSWFGEQPKLRTLLAKFTQSEATQTQDRVFALLGISSDTKGSKFMRPDYSKTEQQVVRNTVYFLLDIPTASPSSYDFLRWTVNDLVVNLADLRFQIVTLAWKFHRSLADKILKGSEGPDLEREDPESTLVVSWGLRHFQSSGESALLEGLVARHKITLSLAYYRLVWKVNDVLLDRLVAALDARPVSSQPGIESLSQETPYIIWAAAHGHSDLTRLLLDYSDSLQSTLKLGQSFVNIEDKHGMTPLAHAAKNGQEGVVALLLETKGAGVDCRDQSGRTPLSHACESKDCIGVIELLLGTKKAKVNSRDKKGRTPLSHACGNMNNTGVVELLLGTKWTDVNSRDKEGRTPLSHACGNTNNTGIVELLLGTNRADVNSRDREGMTPLSHACGNKNNVGTVQILLNNDKQLDSRDANGKTPLFHAYENGANEIVALLLKTRSVDVNLEYKEGRTLLLQACCDKRCDIAKLVLARVDVQINHEDSYGRAALTYAAAYRMMEIVHLILVTSMASVNIASKYTGRTPLMYAIASGHHGVVKALLAEETINANQQDYEGRTALSWGIPCFPKVEIIKLLIDSGKVDVNMPDLKGRSPLWYAVHMRSTSIVQLLLGTGVISPSAVDYVIDFSDSLIWQDNPAVGEVIDFAIRRRHAEEQLAKKLQEGLVNEDSSRATRDALDEEDESSSPGTRSPVRAG